jgi:thymidylate synthase
MEMIREVERDLFEMGIRYQSDTVQDKQVGNDPRYRTIELPGYAYALTGFDRGQLEQMVTYMGNNLEWAKAEEVERLGLDDSTCDPNPGKAWLIDEKKWEQFMRDGLFSYTYAERWLHQLPYIINELNRRPNSRQAIMTMYDVHQDMMNWGGRDRVPCSLTYQFLIRNNELTLIYNQRSCDFMKFFSTDVYITVGLLNQMAEWTNSKPGRLIHFIGSLHAFAGDLEDRRIF